MPTSSPGPRVRSLAIALLITGVLLASFLGTAPAAVAQSPNYISGDACAGGPNPKWQSGDTWIMYGNVTVSGGCTLTIEPGAIVMGDPGVHLYITGSLVAGGTSGTPTQFKDNQTAGVPWAGIQFNAGSSGSVTWSTFDRVLVAVTAISSAPGISNNTIVQAVAGVRLDTSSSLVTNNRIDGQRAGAFGVVAASSNAKILGNTINGTSIGVQGGTSGSLVISGNTFTNLSGAFALGIYVSNLASVTIAKNTFDGALGSLGTPGAAGGSAVAVLVNGTADATITGNSISRFHGGRGGAGANSAIGVAGAGGNGGGAGGIAVGAGSSVLIQSNTVDEIVAGAGGNGGSSASLGNGGAGGRGGDALGIEVFSAAVSTSYLTNSVANVTGGDGGDGGAPAGPAFANGAGGAGGNAYAFFTLLGLNPGLSENSVQYLRGGRGGNSTASLAEPGNGGAGGEADGIISFVDGAAVAHANVVSKVVGGTGGNGVTNGGAGGNATGLLSLGDAISYNSTTISFSQVSSITGGDGGIGGTLSGDGGAAGGIVALHVDPALASNKISNLIGGAGGLAFQLTNQASTGGLASGVAFITTQSASSAGDGVQSVTRGAPGTGHTPAPSYGVGYYMIGDSSSTTRASVTNATIRTTSDYDFYVDNYTDATTLNTPFAASKVTIMSAGNLTVKNFLNVTVLWPNGFTPIWGSRVAVRDNGVEFYNRTAPFGAANWIVVTNRRYVDNRTPVWNTTQVTASYQTYAFANNDRFVNLTQSQTQNFTMVDTTPPSSSALALSPWTNTSTFPVGFFATDGFGVGLKNITLWYRFNRTTWVRYGATTLTILGFGQFSFTAPANGLYEFATTAIDTVGNAQQPAPPTSNNTWTVVDTVAPASHVLALSQYETSLTFTVSWTPNGGVTDVSNYTIQVDTGSGWANWLVNTTLTSATYTATAQGPIAFRALSKDFAGNQESKTGNDTWTAVDTIAPQVASRSPSGTLTASPTVIVVTFSEAMNASSVQAAFQVTPSVTGTFSWSNGSRTLTLLISGSLAVATSYTVTVSTGARDLAGNPLAQPFVFTFATPAPPPAPGFSLLDFWPLFIVIAVVLAALAFLLVRRRGAADVETVLEEPKPAPAATPAKQEAAIDDVFLLYGKDGVLIKHETRRLRPDIDSDILTGMLNAVQAFVKDTLLGAEGDELNEMVLGQMHILIGRGKWLVLAATITGGDMASMTSQISKAIQDMEDHNWDRLEDWNGDMELAKALGPYLKKLIRGQYAA